jgi:hypothetical protein
MDCKRENGCPTPDECVGNGMCEAKAEASFDCETCTFGCPESMSASSRTFSEPLDLTVRRLEAELLELSDKVQRLMDR